MIIRKKDKTGKEIADIIKGLVINCGYNINNSHDNGRFDARHIISNTSIIVMKVTPKGVDVFISKGKNRLAKSILEVAKNSI